MKSPRPTPSAPLKNPRVRRCIFRVTALFLPFCCLAITELSLRFANYGAPTNFFLKTRHNNRDVWIENTRFGWRFFPEALARTPQPFTLPVQKGPRACRIFVFGESAAMGDPDPAFGFPRVLETLLSARYPGAEIQVINTAMTAINSHVIREIARECRPKQGDVWVVYMGNNEVVGPFGAGTVFGARVPSLPLIRAVIALKTTRVGQWIANLTGPSSSFPEWQGMQMFLKRQVRLNDPRMKRVLGHFQKNLEELLSLARNARVPVILTTIVTNEKDFPPLASLNRPGLPPSALDSWTRLHEKGAALALEGNLRAALQSFQQARTLDPTHALLAFQIARVHLLLGQTNEARLNFIRARDLDSLRFRADTAINNALRAAASSRPGAILVDAEQIFRQRSPAGIAGNEFLLDHVHFTFDGNHLLARAAAEAIVPLLPAWIGEAAPTSSTWLSSEECAARLGLTDWNRLLIAREMQQRFEFAPLAQQWNHQANRERWEEMVSQLHRAESPAGLASALQITQDAISLNPQDPALRRNLARLFEASGNPNAAAQQWAEIKRLFPHHDPLP